MLLRVLAPGETVAVWAACDHYGGCQVLDKLEEWESHYPEALRRLAALILEVTPMRGLPKDRTRVKQLHRHIMEFREHQYADEKRRLRKMAALRVAFFFAGPMVYEDKTTIVCTNGFVKIGIERTPDAAIEAALEAHRQYETSIPTFV